MFRFFLIECVILIISDKVVCMKEYQLLILYNIYLIQIILYNIRK